MRLVLLVLLAQCEAVLDILTGLKMPRGLALDTRLKCGGKPEDKVQEGCFAVALLGISLFMEGMKSQL